MPKRGNEHGQLRKEDYEYLDQQTGSSNAGEFQRATGDTLRKRRIIRTGASWKQGNSTSAEGSSSLSSSSSSSQSKSQPFSSFQFEGTTASSLPSSSSSPSSTTKNPFGSVKLAPSNSTGNSSMAAPSNSNSISFGSSSAASNNQSKPFVFGSTSATATKPEMSQREFLVRLNKKIADQIMKEEVRNDWKNISICCVGSWANRMVKDDLDESSKPSTTLTNLAPVPAPSSFTSTAKDDSTTTMKPLFGSSATSNSPLVAKSPAPFSFGLDNKSTATSPTAPSATVPYKFGSTPAKSVAPSGSSTAAPAFSFGSTSTPAVKSPTSEFSFSFSAPKSSAATATPTSAANSIATGVSGSTQTASAEQNEDGNEGTTTELESTDTDWDKVHTVGVRVFVQRKEMKLLIAGKVHLQKHKTKTTTRRMIIRQTSTGKVLFNMSINNSMEFKKSIHKKKDGSERGKISFYGLLDEENGNELFVFVVSRDELDGTFKHLTELTQY